MATLPRLLAPRPTMLLGSCCREAPVHSQLDQPLQLWVPHPSPRQKATLRWLHPGQQPDWLPTDMASDRPSIVSVPAAYCPKALLHSPTPLLRNQQNLSFLNTYFITFLAESGLSCGSRDPRHGMQLLWLYTGSEVVALGLTCPAACGILVPQPKMEPTSPVLQGGVLTTEVPSRFS